MGDRNGRLNNIKKITIYSQTLLHEQVQIN